MKMFPYDTQTINAQFTLLGNVLVLTGLLEGTLYLMAKNCEPGSVLPDLGLHL